jgi:quinol monooxygenase YgiN
MKISLREEFTMIKIVSRNTIKEGKKEVFLSLVKELVEKSRAEEGNISYGLWEDKNDSNVFTFIEDWKDQEAIGVHNATEHFLRIIPQMRELTLAEGKELRLYTQVL